MKMTIPNRNYGLQVALFGLSATGIYLVMIYFTLAHIEAASGHRPFDMRPSGYTFGQADALLNALGAHGRQFYLVRQIPLDLLYPALLALTLVSFFKWLEVRGIGHKLVQFGIWLSIGAAFADYIENAGICVMILSWANLTSSLVLATSLATIVKSGLTMAAVLIVSIGFVLWVFGICRVHLLASSDT